MNPVGLPVSLSSSSESKRSKYYLLGLVGQGQFGQVYCAIHRPTGRLVALKNLAQERFPTHKFLRELRFLLSLQHPNIVTCQALEHTATGRYLVMDYCEGGTLRTLMTEGKQLSLASSLKIITDVLSGLEHAHSRGIIHCDIKPENILLQVQSTGWLARISDFGIARLVREVIAQEGDTGSPAYMAPERFYGQYSAASDLYSVGVLLFELLAGRRPFSGTPAELMSAHLNAPLKQPDAIPVSWQPLIARALQKLPARRFHSAREMLTAIQAIAQQAATAEERAEPVPLFVATDPMPCQFKPVRSLEFAEPVTGLAAVAEAAGTASPELTETTCNLYPVMGQQLIRQQWPGGMLFADHPDGPQGIADPSPQFSIPLNAPIEQILVQAHGCFAVTRRSVMQLSTVTHSLLQIHPIAEWQQDRIVAFAPQGTCFATLASALDSPVHQLNVWRFLHQQWMGGKPFSIQRSPREITQPLRLLVLDTRHLLLMSSSIGAAAVDQTTLQLISRRGNDWGEWSLALNLQHMVPAFSPYQFLAVDQQPGTLLVIDLKPYRVQRFGVEISPKFLTAVAWGYVIADTQGTVAFLDQEGRSLGVLEGPGDLTAITLVPPHGLLLASWNGEKATVWSFDIRTIGLDLIF